MKKQTFTFAILPFNTVKQGVFMCFVDLYGALSCVLLGWQGDNPAYARQSVWWRWGDSNPRPGYSASGLSPVEFVSPPMTL